MVTELSDINWKKYNIIDATKNINNENILKLIDKSNNLNITFINNKLSNEGLSLKDNIELPNNLYKSSFGKKLFAIGKYFKNKMHYAIHVLDLNTEYDNKEISLMLQIYEKLETDISLLDKVHLYYTYATRTLEKHYDVSGSIDTNKLSNIFSRKFISENILKDKKFDCMYKSFKKSKEYICGIYFPSDKERLAETYETPITYCPKESFVIYFDSENNNITFRGNLKYENKFKQEIEKVLNIKLFEWEDGIKFEANKFMNRLQNKGNGELILSALHINGLSIGKDIDILISQNKIKKVDISSKIKTLIETNSISINSFRDISYLKIFYKVPNKTSSKEREIKIKYSEDNMKVKLILDTRDLVPSEKKFLLDIFKEEFGLPLDKTLSSHLFQNGIIDLYRHILQKNCPDKIEPAAKEYFDALYKDKLITLEEDSMWVCSNCGASIDAKQENCPECKNGLSTSSKFISVYKINDIVVMKKCKEIFEDILTNYKFSNIKSDEKYQKFEITNNEGVETYVILSSHKLSKSFIEQLKRESKGCIFILSNENSVIDNIIRNSDLFLNIPLEELLVYDKIKNKDRIVALIKDHIEKTALKSSLLSSNAAITSLENLKDLKNAYKSAKPKGDLFEIDTFNLMRVLFLNAKHLGSKKRGEKVPDGYFDIHLKPISSADYEQKYSFLWDAKYSELDIGYDFTIAEKRKISEYVSKYSKDYEISNYSTSKTLDAFFIIYNKMNSDKFEDISKFIKNNNNSWKGKIIFFNIHALGELSNYVLKNENEYENKKNIFKKRLLENVFKLNSSEDSLYSNVEINDIKIFINNISKTSDSENSISKKIELM